MTDLEIIQNYLADGIYAEVNWFEAKEAAERMANRTEELESNGCGCCANEELCTQEVTFETAYFPEEKDIRKKINFCSAFKRKGESYGGK